MARSRGRWWLRLSQRIAATRAARWLLPRVLPRIDRALIRVSAGRLSLPTVLAKLGIPVVELTTIGAKTGRERRVPVLGIREGERWIVVASNWGRERHPAWYHNLKANPEVEVTYEGRTDEYVAREATGERRAECWERALELNPALETYRQSSGDRRIPVVELVPPGEAAGSDPGQ